MKIKFRYKQGLEGLGLLFLVFFLEKMYDLPLDTFLRFLECLHHLHRILRDIHLFLMLSIFHRMFYGRNPIARWTARSDG